MMALRLVWDITTVEQANGRWSAWCVLEGVQAPVGARMHTLTEAKPYIVRSRRSEEEAKMHLAAMMTMVTTRAGLA